MPSPPRLHAPAPQQPGPGHCPRFPPSPTAVHPLRSSTNFNANQLRRRPRATRKPRLTGSDAAKALICELVLELQEPELRENGLRCLSGCLEDKREHDEVTYQDAGFLIYNSCGTLAILLQELIAVYPNLACGELNVRGCKRVDNVLTILQCVSANRETQVYLLQGCVLDWIFPFICNQQDSEAFDRMRLMSLSILGVICQVGC
eukprot:SM000143S00731  [mRNA]  locus=s143:90423:91643:+ [translate_table: standard]